MSLSPQKKDWLKEELSKELDTLNMMLEEAQRGLFDGTDRDLDVM